jgi:hypothetical protein
MSSPLCPHSFFNVTKPERIWEPAFPFILDIPACLSIQLDCFLGVAPAAQLAFLEPMIPLMVFPPPASSPGGGREAVYGVDAFGV